MPSAVFLAVEEVHSQQKQARQTLLQQATLTTTAALVRQTLTTSANAWIRMRAACLFAAGTWISW
jgi:hypothetical protein